MSNAPKIGAIAPKSGAPRGGAMKLTEPQKQVLRTMLEFDSIISVVPWGGRWDISAIPDLEYGPFRPRVATLRVLRRLGLLHREPIGGLEFEFSLAPKGREIAEELQDEPGGSARGVRGQ